MGYFRPCSGAATEFGVDEVLNIAVEVALGVQWHMAGVKDMDQIKPGFARRMIVRRLR